MTLLPSKAVFKIGDLLKTSRPGHHLSEVVFKAYAPDRRLCILTTLTAYLQRTLDNRWATKQLFLTTKPPFRAASQDTLRRWIRQVLVRSGIDITTFAPHSVRAAATSTAAFSLPLMTIVKAIGWTSQSTFATYYHKPVVKDGTIATAVLNSIL